MKYVGLGLLGILLIILLLLLIAIVRTLFDAEENFGL